MLGGAGSVVLVFCMMPKAEVGTKSRVQPFVLLILTISCFFFELSFRERTISINIDKMSYLFLLSIQAWEAV